MVFELFLGKVIEAALGGRDGPFPMRILDNPFEKTHVRLFQRESDSIGGGECNIPAGSTGIREDRPAKARSPWVRPSPLHPVRV